VGLSTGPENVPNNSGISAIQGGQMSKVVLPRTPLLALLPTGIIWRLPQGMHTSRMSLKLLAYKKRLIYNHSRLTMAGSYPALQEG
jgi:hypothetical protein